MNRLIAFQKVVELGSFTKAANALGFTQSAISQMITSLESEMAIKLLDRSRNGVLLTLEGRKIYPFIENLLLQRQVMTEKINEIKGLETGVIRIGTISSISCHWLPQLIKAFQEKYPKVEFILHQGDYTTIPEWVRQGEVDFGFINPDVKTGMATTFIKTGELRAVLPKDSPLANQAYVTLADLAKQPFLQLEEGIFSEPMAAFHQAGLQPDVKLCVHDDYSIMSMVESGLGVSILPALVLNKTNYDIKILPLQPTVTRKIGIVKKNQATLSLASQKFIDYLLSQIETLP
ncbi:LysR family transcriptional regulator [Agrilactobacillus composti DSM 18527 = JCM 14202]|uniref:LysR family transcriptional regulator n=1 Tax=Agrilactobacillus composti DSM 18527 = JCM 14202 TaxID=1423734 RepID=X0PDU9_9LACO|nr:LysR family transcriptional regulator [Agrilactobacillus composti]KRM31628.1 LysR family transcriptional regulator [Agrilactobacillus composti DSM 18527 = JCM 14202]GAF39338.1 LysR family transcriptional regulator [Agrilactobacillus composti DSM 18527 = JCM 14202]